MIVVVADTSPLNYLIQIDCHELLPALYGRVLIPSAVFEELQHSGTPATVFGWAQQLPPWIDVRKVSFEPDSTLDGLGTGEREAIQLGERERADLLLIDEGSECAWPSNMAGRDRNSGYSRFRRALAVWWIWMKLSGDCRE